MNKPKILILFLIISLNIYPKCSQYSFLSLDKDFSNITSLLLNAKVKVTLLPKDSVQNECFYLESKAFVKKASKAIKKSKDISKKISAVISFAELKTELSIKLYWNPSDKKTRQEIIKTVLLSIEEDFRKLDALIYALPIEEQKKLLKELEHYEMFKINHFKRSLKLWEGIDWFATTDCYTGSLRNSVWIDTFDRELACLINSRSNYIKYCDESNPFLNAINERISYYCGGPDDCRK